MAYAMVAKSYFVSSTLSILLFSLCKSAILFQRKRQEYKYLLPALRRLAHDKVLVQVLRQEGGRGHRVALPAAELGLCLGPRSGPNRHGAFKHCEKLQNSQEVLGGVREGGENEAVFLQALGFHARGLLCAERQNRSRKRAVHLGPQLPRNGFAQET